MLKVVKENEKYYGSGRNTLVKKEAVVEDVEDEVEEAEKVKKKKRWSHREVEEVKKKVLSLT